MTTCRQVASALDRHLSGDLARDETATLEAHLAGCEGCRRFAHSYRATVEVARATTRHPDEAPPAAVPEGLVRSILAARRRNPS